MHYKVQKFFDLSFKDGNTFCKIKPALDTMKLFKDNFLIHRKNEAGDIFEVYYPSLSIDPAKPYPKLSIGKELYFIADYRDENLSYGKMNLYNSTDPDSQSIIDIRKNKTLFKIPCSEEYATIIIKNLSGTGIHREAVSILEDSDNNAIYSFDFTKYPFGIYTIEFDGDNIPRSTFVIDKYGELNSYYTLIRVVYDDTYLKYKAHTTQFQNSVPVIQDPQFEFTN